MDNFVQAARKVIIKNRLVKVLNLLKKFINSWNEALLETSDSCKSFIFKFQLLDFIFEFNF